MREFFKGTLFVLIIMLAISAFISLVFAIAISAERYDCKKLSPNIGYETKYEFWGGGCLIKIENQWVPRNKWINNTGN